MSEIIDSLGVREAILSIPDQMYSVLDSLGNVAGLPSLDEVDHVLILGMGDSGFSGEVIAAGARSFSSLPIVVYNGYLPPSWISKRTLVIALSATGETEETLESLEAAISSGAPIIALTKEGQLAKIARGAGASVIEIDSEALVPRAALGHLAASGMLVLEQLGLFLGARVWLTEAAEVLQASRQQLASQDSQAKDLADLLEGVTPVIYGGGSLGVTAAKRWKTSINLNSKIPSFWAPMPDLCYNELLGWQSKEASQAYSQVQLRHSYEHPDIERRYDFVGENSLQSMSHILTVQASGEGPLAQLFDLILMGDMVSLEIAANAEVDPGPTVLNNIIEAINNDGIESPS